MTKLSRARLSSLICTLLLSSWGVTASATRLASLETAEGGRVSVFATYQEHSDTSRLGYEVRDRHGRAQEGELQLQATLLDESVSLAQNPVTNELFLIASVWRELDDAGSFDLQARQWQGQGWGEASWLTETSWVDEVHPALTFNARGEAVLVWNETGDWDEEIRLLHGFLVDGDFDSALYLSLGSPELYLQPVMGDVNLRSGVAHVFAANDADASAYVLLGDPDDERIAVLQLRLAYLRETVGGSTLPVPVTLLDTGLDSVLGGASGPGGPGSGLDEEATDAPQPDGRQLSPYWGAALGGELFYWFDGSTARGFAVRGHQATSLISVDVGLGNFLVPSAQRQVSIVSRLIDELRGIGYRNDDALGVRGRGLEGGRRGR